MEWSRQICSLMDGHNDVHTELVEELDLPGALFLWALGVASNPFRRVVLKGGNFFIPFTPQGNRGQCLEMFGMVMMGEVYIIQASITVTNT